MVGHVPRCEWARGQFCLTKSGLFKGGCPQRRRSAERSQHVKCTRGRGRTLLPCTVARGRTSAGSHPCPFGRRPRAAGRPASAAAAQRRCGRDYLPLSRYPPGMAPVDGWLSLSPPPPPLPVGGRCRRVPPPHRRDRGVPPGGRATAAPPTPFQVFGRPREWSQARARRRGGAAAGLTLLDLPVHILETIT